MKLLRYGLPGEERPGLLDRAGAIRDLSGEIDDLAGDSLLPETLERLRALDPSTLPPVVGSPRIGTCVGAVSKYLAIGLNYSDHAAEVGVALPEEPLIFTKAVSSICGPGDDTVIPQGGTKMDHEVELGIVIGRGGVNVPEAEALAHIAGYCTLNDVSERAFQLEGSGQWVKGKSADTFGPIGPWLVTPDEIADPQDLALWCEVNGTRFQDGSTRTMVFGVYHLVSYVSRFMRLQPGDVIATGTPPGVGHGAKPPRYLKAGDRVRLSVEGLGVQEQTLVEGA
ncbi:MAG: fumarylacetoacetate hydrolase family protein [Pseudomonadota bacterium]